MHSPTSRRLTLLGALAVVSLTFVAPSSAQTTAPAKKPVASKKAPAKKTAQTTKTAKAAQPSAEAATSGGGEPTDPPAGSSPLEELKKSHQSLRKIIAKQPADWSPEKDAKTSEVRKLVGQFMDSEELAKRALNKHWDGLTREQRTEFVSTLRELVDRSYLKQMHGKAEYDVTFDKEDIKGREAKVFATLDTVVRGKKTKVALEFRLVHKRGWVVYDMVTDEQSLLETYRAEFNKIINKESFDALLKRMKKKLDDKPVEK